MKAEGSTTYSHGEYNFIVYMIILVFMNFVAFNVFIAMKLKKYVGLVLAGLMILSLYLGIPCAIYFLKIRNTCQGNWDAGLNGSRMLQN